MRKPSGPKRHEQLLLKKEKALAKQQPVNLVTLDFLRQKEQALMETAKSLQEEAGQTGDPECWDAAKFTRGEASMCRELMAHIKGLSHEEFFIQLREGKL